MNLLIDTYIKKEFGEDISLMPNGSFLVLREAITSILHSHRYNKQEEFTRDVDFSVVRGVLYSYTQYTRHRFISNPACALIYHHFFVNGAYKFLNSKAQCKSKVIAIELEEEFVRLHYEAIKTLQ